MIVDFVGSEEVLELNDTHVAVTIKTIGNQAIITSKHSVTVRITDCVGSKVLNRLGENSKLIFERNIKIGHSFKVEIPGNKARIITNGMTIPQDASFTPTPG